MSKYGPKPTDPATRFWSKVDKSGECWLWTAGKLGAGYGKFYLDGVNTGAHRAAWILERGEIPAGMEVCHSCDVMLCVRPSHLFLATHNENVADMMQKGRQYTRPLHGDENGNAKLTVDDVRQMREEFASGTRAPALARRYGVTPNNVRAIVKRQTWANVV